MKNCGFFHFSGTSHHFVVIHCAQGYNSHSSLADIAEHCKAAIESKLSAVNAPESVAFIRGRMSALSYCRVPTIVSPAAKGTQGGKLSVVMLHLVFLNGLHNCWSVVSPRFL